MLLGKHASCFDASTKTWLARYWSSCGVYEFKDTGTKFAPHFSFVMLNYFRTNQYEEP